MTSPTAPPADKRQWRRLVRAARRARTLPDPERVAVTLASDAVAALESLLPVPAATVTSFASLPTEPPTSALNARLRAAGHRVLLPLLRTDFDLDWHEFDGDDVGGDRGRTALPPEAVATASLVIVPALAVDTAGRRLGQGGGSYDRALARVGAPVVALVWADEAVAGPLPVEAHDRPVDGVLAAGDDGRLTLVRLPSPCPGAAVPPGQRPPQPREDVP